MLDARALGPRERVPADEALVRGRLGDDPLGGADVGHDAVRAGGCESLRDRLRELSDGRGDEDRVGARDGLLRAGGGLVYRAERECVARTRSSGS